MHGLLYFLPIYLVTLVAGGLWEALFAGVRNHEVNEGFLVTSFLYTLILPATLPLWQVALGICFGVVIGKEVFGGTGKNVLNPALIGRAFLFLPIRRRFPGTVWTAVAWVEDGFTGATPLAQAAEAACRRSPHRSYLAQAFIGQMQGLGSTSALACLFGAAILIFTGIASWRIIAAVSWG